MKITQILFFLLSLAYGHSVCAMEKPRKAKQRFKIDHKKPILKQVLVSEHKRVHRKLKAGIKKSYKSNLNLLYDEALEQNRTNKEAIPATELPTLWNTTKDQIISLEQDLLFEILRYGDNGLRFKDISPIIDQFKKEKGFGIAPNLDTITLETMLRFHAMLRTITNSLNEINEWISPTGEVEEDI